MEYLLSMTTEMPIIQSLCTHMYGIHNTNHFVESTIFKYFKIRIMQ